MFPTYPGFEAVTIRAEIHWQERTRPLMARVAKWPLSDQLIFAACHFDDDIDDGEWVLLSHLGIFTFPAQILDNQAANAEKLVSIIERQLHQSLVYLGRLVELPLPAHPRLALCSPVQHMHKSESNYWVKNAIFYECFDFADSPFQLNADGVRAALLNS